MIDDNYYFIGFIFFILIICVLVCIIGGLHQQDTIERLKRRNERLEQQVIDYKWQLEQIEYIMEEKEK